MRSKCPNLNREEENDKRKEKEKGIEKEKGKTILQASLKNEGEKDIEEFFEEFNFMANDEEEEIDEDYN